MQIRHLLLASLVSIAACGGGSKKPAVEPAAPEPAPAPPPAPKLALGDVKIVLKGAKKTEVSGEFKLAADGTLTATMTSTKKKETKTVVSKVSAEGELTDDKGEVIARIDGDGKVETLHQMEEKHEGKTMKSEKSYVDVGKLDDTGTFTIKKDGKTVTIDDKGQVVGLGRDVALTITAAPEQRKAAMFIVVAMLGSSKVVMDMGGAKADPPATVPTKK
jgi:hypothetical protein